MKRRNEKENGWTMIEVLSVCIIIGIIASFAIPSYMQARRVVYEDNCISRLQRIALAESRYYSEFNTFGNFTELQTANLLPKGYSTVYYYMSPVSQASILPFIERYSLTFTIPDSANSLYYKVDAIPMPNNQMGLRTFNINLILTGEVHPDSIFQVPPVREGLEVNGTPVTVY